MVLTEIRFCPNPESRHHTGGWFVYGRRSKGRVELVSRAEWLASLIVVVVFLIIDNCFATYFGIYIYL